jgi:predicted MFS family arabinose efflux permease
VTSPLIRSVGTSLGAVRTVFTEPDLARLQLGWFATNAGKWAFLVGNLVLAYDAGGTAAVGLLSLVRYLTPTLLAPLAGLPAARWRPERVLLATTVARTVAVAAGAVVLATGAPLWSLFVVVGLEAAAGAFTRPLHMGLLPSVSRSTEQLVAANVTSSAAEGLGTFVGPAVAGLLLVAAGPLTVIVAVVAVYAVGVAAIAGMHVASVGHAGRSTVAVRRQLAAGARAVIQLPGPRLVFVGFLLQTFVRGLLTVLTVAAAIELLGMGDPGVGALNAALGVGGLIGASTAIILVGRPRLGPAFVLALAGWGAPIMVIGLIPEAAIALGAMLLIGISNSLLDVAGFTLAQRTSPNAQRVAVMGLLDAAANAGVALGAIAAPLLISLLGLPGALVVSGAILPAAALLMWPVMRRVDETRDVSGRQTSLIRGVPLFAPLSMAVVEHLADTLERVDFPAGAWVLREGEAGDRFFIIDDGSAQVIQGSRPIRTVGPGDAVGEIALMRDIPRTASVRAVTPLRTWVLDRGTFLESVTGDALSFRAANALVDQHLSGGSPTNPDAVVR